MKTQLTVAVVTMMILGYSLPANAEMTAVETMQRKDIGVAVITVTDPGAGNTDVSDTAQLNHLKTAESAQQELKTARKHRIHEIKADVTLANQR